LASLANANPNLTVSVQPQQPPPQPVQHSRQRHTNQRAVKSENTSDNEVKRLHPKKVAFDTAKVTLTPASLNRVFQDAIETLYGNFGLQCEQCAFRFPDTVEGQQRMNAHLDMHYRHARRNQEQTKTLHSRDWFLSEIVFSILLFCPQLFIS
jgi:hypothetical protein